MLFRSVEGVKTGVLGKEKRMPSTCKIAMIGLIYPTWSGSFHRRANHGSY